MCVRDSAYSPALASQANLPHTFSQLWTAAPGVYDVCVITSNPNGGTDLNPFDDTTCITISVFDSVTVTSGCLLYTSDAAAERSSVDLGGRRILKKKKQVQTPGR